jgi:hypothetical protein
MSWLRDWVAMGLMIAAVVATYVPPRPHARDSATGCGRLLHPARAADAVRAGGAAGTDARLPNWYPRELCGTPFWSNVQNFPFVPTRLLVLLTLDPYAPYTYAIATTLAAILAAGFTYLFCRRIKLGALAAATAGYTFVACGYFSARVAVGHLPLLEVYAGPPGFALGGRSADPGDRAPFGHRAARVGAGATHHLRHARRPPAVAGLRDRDGRPVCALSHARRARHALAAGRSVGARGWACAGFALVPMAMLVSRSTRVLPDLERPFNDLPFAYRRLSVGCCRGWGSGSRRRLRRATC